ncbi:MAG: hypothetical protein ACREI2_09710 [Nitrospiraceae bacterium]
MRKPYLKGGSSLGLLVAAFWIFASPTLAQQTAGQEEKPIHMCPGCLTPVFTEQGKGGITPYGRIEIDAIYSTRNTNPLDPAQFNGYGTAAGPNSNSSSTLNPRYSVIGIRGERTDGTNSLVGVVEGDFFGEKDIAGNILFRLRLAYAKFSRKNYSLTVGQDWTPVMALHPDLIDFSILGYGGNLWQRIPQITFRYQFNENLEGLLTVLRFERGLYAIGGQRQVRPSAAPPGQGDAPGNASSNDAFSDPIQHPYYGTRLAYNKDGRMIAASAAYRYYRSAPIPGGAVGFGSGGFTSGRDINSYLIGAEVVYPLTKTLKFSGELGYGQAIGQEFFRFGQDLNLTTGKPIRTMMGWGQLSWAASRKYTFLAGSGFDNPNDRDVQGSTANSGTQYESNYRTYLTAIHPIWSDFYVGLEWQHLWTTWAVTTGPQHYEGDMYNIAFWYNF